MKVFIITSKVHALQKSIMPVSSKAYVNCYTGGNDYEEAIKKVFERFDLIQELKDQIDVIETEEKLSTKSRIFIRSYPQSWPQIFKHFCLWPPKSFPGCPPAFRSRWALCWQASGIPWNSVAATCCKCSTIVRCLHLHRINSFIESAASLPTSLSIEVRRQSKWIRIALARTATYDPRGKAGASWRSCCLTYPTCR